MLARIAAALWALGIVVTLGIAAVAPAVGARMISHVPRCPLLATTSVQCPFCGMSRASIALVQGDLSTALALHPLAPLVLGLMLAVLVIIVVGRSELITRGRRPYVLLASVAVIWGIRLVV